MGRTRLETLWLQGGLSRITRITTFFLGGPGQSGVAAVAGWAGWLSDEVLRRLDVVTFDPRGIGASGVD